MADKIRIEFSSLRSKFYGSLHINHLEERIDGISSREFGEALEKVSKKVFLEWVEGCNIYFVTPRQLKKLKELLKK